MVAQVHGQGRCDRGEQQPQRLLANGQRLGRHRPAGDERSHRLEQELVRATRTALLGLARQHHHPVGQAGQQLLDEPGLAHAGLAAHQRDLRLAGPLKQPLEARQLHAAPHHHRAQSRSTHQHADDTIRHAGHRAHRYPHPLFSGAA
jgi:hypothetical protein